MDLYRSLQINYVQPDNVKIEQATLRLENLQSNDLLIEVKHAALSYRDALALSGAAKLPNLFVPGVDAAGIVVRSKSKDFLPGDEVAVTGRGLGSKISGAFGQYISVPMDWAIHTPIGMSTKQAATLGSAGISAGLAVAFMSEMQITQGCVAVTMGDFDFGSIASALFSIIGYEIVAFTKNHETGKNFLQNLSVKNVYSMDEILKGSHKNDKYEAIFDIAGGSYLSELMTKNVKNNGLIVSADNIFGRSPLYIDRLSEQSLTLKGANPFECDTKIKERIWNKFTGEWKLPLDWICSEISMDEVESVLPDILSQSTKGRFVINMEI